MRISFPRLATAWLACGLALFAQDNTTQTPMRGWLSDENCARGRANGGVYTGTNPDCAKQCVAKGAKIVLIVPDQKQIFFVSNPEQVTNDIGDYVEVTGVLDAKAKTIRVASLKMITRGSASCARPKSSK